MLRIIQSFFGKSKDEMVSDKPHLMMRRLRDQAVLDDHRRHRYVCAGSKRLRQAQ